MQHKEDLPIQTTIFDRCFIGVVRYIDKVGCLVELYHEEWPAPILKRQTK